MIKTHFRNHPFLAFSLLGGALALCGYGYWHYQHRYRPERALARAKDLLEHNLTFLAIDEVEPFSKDVPKTQDSCDSFIKAFHRAGFLQKMAWWSEACINANVQIPSAYLGLAAFYEASGSDRDALSILVPQAKRFDKSAELPYEVFRILEKQAGLESDAISYLIQAQVRAEPYNMLARDPLRELINAGKWEEAQRLADGIANHPSVMNDLSFRTLVADVYRHNGEVGLAKRFESGSAVSRSKAQ